MFLAAALALLALQDSAELLPDVPDGWRFERLDFPLSFAPDLEYEGFEELAFAPGMFDPESDSYFSYALALRLEGDRAFDEEQLSAFLTRYYRGLCEAVGEGRKSPLDLSGFGVDVRRVEDGYEATIQMVDAFVTGEPLELELEITTWAGPGRIEWIGIASPSPKNATVWTELRGIRIEWGMNRGLPVFLDHVVMELDAATYEAVAGSSELRQLFGAHEQQTEPGAPTFAGRLQLFGTRTQVAFECQPDARVNAATRTAVGLGIELEKAVGMTAWKLSRRGIEIESTPKQVFRAGGVREVPWYRFVNALDPSANPDFELTLRSYDPQFLAGWHPTLAPPGGGIRRRDVLERIVARLGQTEARAAASVEDVREVFVDLTPSDSARIAQLAEVFGYTTNSGPGGDVYIGPSVRFVVQESSGPSRVTGFRLALREAVEEKRTLTLGRASLSLQGRAATFHYRP